jgi:electron transfer flavoprotein-quinone oxidoreductase
VLSLPGLAASGRRPEQVIDSLKRHPAIAPLVAEGELLEYSAHLVPEGGYQAMPELVTDGMLVAGDAAAMTLAAGLYLEGVNFAIGSGAMAAAATVDALRKGDTTAAGLAGYRRRLERSFVLKDHRKFRRAAEILLAERAHATYPQLVCGLAERIFTVQNPAPKRGLIPLGLSEMRRAGVRLRDVARDAYIAARTYG